MKFTPEVVFPPDPLDSTFIYLAAMAYPEVGAGVEHKSGAKFADALADYVLWSCRSSNGLRWMRQQRSDNSFTSPDKRSFEGRINQGTNRVRQRLAAYDLYAETLFQNVMRSIIHAPQERSDEISQDAVRSVSAETPKTFLHPFTRTFALSQMQTMRRSLQHWEGALKINNTRRSDEEGQRVKDLNRRALAPSRPVLHMAHGFRRCCVKFGPTFQGWDQRDHLEAMLMNGPIWIWEAIELAEAWRSSATGGLSRKPPKDQMIHLIRE